MINHSKIKRHPHILIVDEITANKIKLAELLAILKYRTYILTEEEDPLEIFEKHKSHINFLLLNMIRPEVPDGVQLLKRLKKIDPNSKVICMGDNTAKIDDNILKMDNFSLVNGTMNFYHLLRQLN